MPKVKSNSGAKKRLRLTGSGKLKRKKAFKRHILTKKSAKRKNNLGKTTVVHDTQEIHLKTLVPYL
jgi:large subunit ribosomal protein L35